MHLGVYSLVGALIFAMTAGPRTASALELLDRAGLTVSLDVEAGIGGFLTKNTNFGVGRIDQPGGEISGDAQWGEGYLKPTLRWDYDTSSAGVIYGGTSVVGSITLGDGDAGGFTDGGDSRISLEALYGGWRSGSSLTDSLGGGTLDLSAGRQEFRLADGFLIWNGNLQVKDDGAYWLNPREAFQLTGLGRLDSSPLDGQLFYLRGGTDQGSTELVGGNLDYDLSGVGLGAAASLGAMYLQITDVDAPFQAVTPRDGMQVATIRADEVRVPGFENAGLYAQYARQFGDGGGIDFDAEAFYVEPFYEFSSLPWSPRLAYRFAYFSGDADPNDSRRTDFDPLFYGTSRGWGTWVQGEIVGEYLLFNNNQINHMVHLSAKPTDDVSIGALYFHFDLAEKNYLGTPVTQTDFADEVDVYTEWTITQYLSVGAAGGVAWPGTAAREVFASDPYYLFEAYAILTF